MSYLCASDSAISLREISVQLEIVHLRGKVANPDGGINLKPIMLHVKSINCLGIIYHLSGSQTGRVVVQLESHRRVRSGDDLKQTVNCHHPHGQ